MKKILSLVLATVLVLSNTQLLNAATDVKNDAGLSTSLVSYWELEEASGTRVDSHGANDLTDNNTVGQTTGIQGNASDHIRANNEFLSNTGIGALFGNAWTFSAWINFPNIGSADQTVISLRPSSGSVNLIQLETNTSINQGRLIVFNSSGTFVKDYRITRVTPGSWHHLVVTWDGSTLNFYVNADSTSNLTKAADSALTMTSTARTLRIGAELATSNISDGAIDEVGFWTRALSSTEVSDLYNSGAGIPYDAGGAAPRRIINIQ